MCASKDDFLTNIYISYAHRLERFCLQYIHYQAEYRDLIDDCIQKTFELATREYEELSVSSHVEAWLFKTCLNRLTSSLKTYRRRNKRQSSLDTEVSFSLPQEEICAAIDEMANHLSNQELLTKIMAALNEREREVVQRHLILGESFSEIARGKGTSIGAIKALLARSRSKARKIRDKNMLLSLTFFVSFWYIMRLFK